MAVQPFSCTITFVSHFHPHHFPDAHPNSNNPTHFGIFTNPIHRRRLLLNVSAFSRLPTARPEVKQAILGLAASASATVLLLGFGLRVCSATPSPPCSQTQHSLLQELLNDDVNGEPESCNAEKQQVDEQLRRKFDAWKSKSFALSVPLKIIALQGSVPPSWTKDFLLSQGKRLKLQMRFRATLDEIFYDLSSPFTEKGKTNIKPSSAVAADLVSVGDSWLSFAISNAIIEPIRAAEEQDWFKGLSPKWKAYLRRNRNGDVDPNGEIWAAPYRWGCMVIAYNRYKFQKHNLAPIKDWADLWRPELAGKISMVNSPREVLGLVLKYMGAQYNTTDIDSQVSGGRNAVQRNLALLGKQVRLFDSKFYLKSFALGDVWVVVGCSSDVFPAAKRISNVAVVVPESGSNLWADLWAIPAASRLATSQLGGRIRGPSLLIHQWIEFCLQVARGRPFQQGVTVGAPPSSLECAWPQLPELKGGASDATVVPPPEILAKCEFLEPLPEATLSDYRWLIYGMLEPRPGLVCSVAYRVTSMVQDLISNISGH